MTNNRSGVPPISRIPPSEACSFAWSRSMPSLSFLVRPSAPSAIRSSISFSRWIDWDTVFQFVSVPPQPAVVHVVLRAFLRRLGDRLLRLPLGADEENTPALRHRLADRVQRRVQHRDGLGQVDDVNAVPVAIDELAHARVPSLGLVAEVNARFEKLTQRKVRQRHELWSFPVSCPRRGHDAPFPGQPADRWGCLPRTAQTTPVKCARS